jgi:hypothetical protein
MTPKWKPARKYDPLMSYLQDETGTQVTLTYTKVEQIIAGELPASATSTLGATARTWWYAEPGHCQADAWLNAGWRVCRVDVEHRAVTFKRIEDNE